MKTRRPTYAGVTATLALFVALGGSSYAAVTITSANVRNNSLTGSDVKNESLKSGDIDNGTVTGSDLKNGSVSSSDIDDASLLGADFKAGELPAGPAGPAGPQGPAGANNVVARRANEVVPDNQFRVVVASCLSGEVAVGGGGGVTGFLNDASIFFDEPREEDGSDPEDGEPATKWAVGAANSSGNTQIANAHVLCASP
jgi:hypothetical protein